jgi:hypothetical protein
MTRSSCRSCLSPLAGEVDARSAPGEGACRMRRCFSLASQSAERVPKRSEGGRAAQTALSRLALRARHPLPLRGRGKPSGTRVPHAFAVFGGRGRPAVAQRRRGGYDVIGNMNGVLEVIAMMLNTESPPHPDRFAVRPLPASGER